MPENTREFVESQYSPWELEDRRGAMDSAITHIFAVFFTSFVTG